MTPDRRRVPGGWLLVPGLPLLLLAALLPVNEYREALGLDAADCEGPFRVLLAAVPALFLHAGVLAMNLQRWRHRRNAMVVALCLSGCALAMSSIVSALAEEHCQVTACAS
ncbi:MAG: hypothetical protein INR70_31325 [Parafilimonas terrae]|nr:hypothetical protein [Parafilimonas terrae]